jgi:hypothetical protein
MVVYSNKYTRPGTAPSLLMGERREGGEGEGEGTTSAHTAAATSN